MKSNSIFELNPKVFEFEKNVPRLKPQGVKLGEIGLKPTFGEPPNKFKVPRLGLKVLLKKKNHITFISTSSFAIFHFTFLSQ